MMRWRDLGAGLGAAPRVALRWDYWWEVLRRLLFSHVFLGYAALVASLYFGTRALLGGPAGFALLTVGIFVLPLLVLLFVPYACWVFNPAAARVLPEYLDLPTLRVDEEPPFLFYVLWTVPGLAILLATMVLLASGHLAIHGFSQGILFDIVGGAGSLLAGLALMTVFVRASLATHYSQEEVRRFLKATRWQRRLLWPVLVLAVGWAVHLGLTELLRALGLLSPAGLDPRNPWGIDVKGRGLLLGLDFLISTLVGIGYTGALLRACSRSAPGPESSAAPVSETLVLEPRRGRRRRSAKVREARAHRGRVAAMAIVAFVGLCGGLYLARLSLADGYLGRDESYARMPALVDELFPPSSQSAAQALESALAANRLRAGYIAYGCAGKLEHALWIDRLGVVGDHDRARLLTCAACGNNKPAVDWVLQQQPQPDPNVAMRVDGGGRPQRTALACAARHNDLQLAKRLVDMRASLGSAEDPQSPLQQAIAQRHWPMVRYLATHVGFPGGALRAALQEAAWRDAKAPAEILPRLLEAGFRVEGADRQQRTLFHWAAQRQDLALAKALLARPVAPAAGPAQADAQGVLPWMLVLRKAELEGKPMTDDALELLRLLLPPQADVNARVGAAAKPADGLLPAGWNAGAATLSQPAARALLGPELDHGLLPGDPQTWWKFNSYQDAETFIRSATVAQLERAEAPEALPGQLPRKLSTALIEAGWSPLVDELLLKLHPPPPPRGKRR